MNYWIFVTTEENWPIVRSKGLFGIRGRWKNLIKRVRRGDMAFVYLMSTRKGREVIPPRIVGLFEVVSEPFSSSERVFKNDVYPLRVKIQPVLIASKPLEFKPLLSKLKFAQGTRNYSGKLRSGMAKIPEEDYLLIRRELERLERLLGAQV